MNLLRPVAFAELRHALCHVLSGAPLQWKKAASIDACAGVSAPHKAGHVLKEAQLFVVSGSQFTIACQAARDDCKMSQNWSTAQ